MIGGRDKNYQPNYIGQVFVDKGLIPTTLYSDGREVIFEFDGVKKTRRDVKILCSRYRHKFYWLPVTIDTLRLVTNAVPIIGGFERDFILNIGRVFYQDEVIVGKITYMSFFCAKDTKTISFTSSFEALVYNETATNTCYNTPVELV